MDLGQAWLETSFKSPPRYSPACPGSLDLQDSLGHVWFYVASLGSELRILHRRHSVAAHSLLRIFHCVTSGNLNYCTSVSLDKTLARCLLSRPVLTSPTPVVLLGHLRAFTRTSTLHASFSAMFSLLHVAATKILVKENSLVAHQKPGVAHTPHAKIAQHQ